MLPHTAVDPAPRSSAGYYLLLLYMTGTSVRTNTSSELSSYNHALYSTNMDVNEYRTTAKAVIDESRSPYGH